jgi:hypothetical protein
VNLRVLCGSGLWDFRQNQPRVFCDVALPSEPILHCVFQFSQRNVGSNFHQAVGHRQGIIKGGRVGEVAHREAIQPLQRAGKTAAALLVLHANLAGKHVSDLTTQAHLGHIRDRSRLIRNHVGTDASTGQASTASALSGSETRVRLEPPRRSHLLPYSPDPSVPCSA